MNHHFFLSIVHLLLIAPFLFFVGFQRAATPSWVFNALFIVGGIILFYHGIKLFVLLSQNVSYAWVNALHVLLVAPLLILIGYHNKNTPRYMYELLLILTFGLVGYHMMNIIRLLETNTELAME